MTTLQSTSRMLAVCAVAGFSLSCAGESDGPTRVHPNISPTLQALPDTCCAIGDTLCLQAHVTDEDQNAVTFRLTVVLRGSDLIHFHRPDACLDETSGLFQFLPKAEDHPRREFIIAVEDTHGGTDSCRFGVDVPCP